MAILDHPVFKVEGGHEVGAMLLHGGNAFVGDVAAVLDGVNAGFSSPENPLLTVGVRGHLAAEAVGVGDESLHFFKRELGGIGVVALGEHAAGGADLDEIGTVLDVLPHHVLHSGNAVGYAVADRVVLEWEQILVAVSAGDADERAADLHVRSGDLAGVDGVAQVDIDKVVGAHVADGGEARHQSGAGVGDTVDGLLCGSRRDFAERIKVSVHGEVGVHVNEAGQDGERGEIEDRVRRLGGNGGRGSD